MVLVTGATGHLGTVLVHQLVERGDQVRYLARSEPTDGLRECNAEWIQGDICDEDVVRRALSGVDTVYHAAALISIMPRSWDELFRVNVLGTRTLLQCSRTAGVRRFVHVGSVEAFPLVDGPRPLSEEQAIDPMRTAIEYGRSKAIAVLEVLAASDDMDCIVCAPTSFLGPPDYRRSPIGEVIHDYLLGKLPALVEGGFDFVDVRDIADGVIRAGEHGKTGRIYLLSGRYATLTELFDLVERASGIRKPRLCLPQWLLRPFTPAIELYYRITGRPPQFTRGSLKLIRLNVTVDSSRARNELGYDPRPLEETVADTVEWFKKQLDPTGS